MVFIRCKDVFCSWTLNEWSSAIILPWDIKRVLRIREGQQQELLLAFVALMQPGLITSEGIALLVFKQSKILQTSKQYNNNKQG